eukprot:6411792-Prymnesium_polylepis.1
MLRMRLARSGNWGRCLARSAKWSWYLARSARLDIGRALRASAFAPSATRQSPAPISILDANHSNPGAGGGTDRTDAQTLEPENEGLAIR